jgi:hypothetical protein
LKETAQERHKLFRGLYSSAKNLRKLSLAQEQATAERLFVLLFNYRKTTLSNSYAEEAAAMFNLLQDLKGHYAADVTLLGLDKWVALLDANEQKFVDYRMERDKENALKPTEDLRKIRAQGDILYRSMTDVLYAKLVVDGLGGDVDISPDDLKTGIYEDGTPSEKKGNIVYNFVVAWNIVLKRYHNTLAARIGRRKKDKNPIPDEGNQPMED